MFHPKHLQDFADSGITPDTMRRAGIRSVTPEEASKLSGWRLKHPAWAVPYHPLRQGDEPIWQVKVDVPVLDKDKKLSSYRFRKKTPNRLYVLPWTRSEVSDPGQPLIVTEGVKKVLKATQEGFLCVGLVGVWSWRQKEPKGPIPDLDFIPWQGRAVTICFDSDAMTKPEVHGAVRAFGAELENRGAVVRVAIPPEVEGVKKTGIDDYLDAKGATAFRKVLGSALPLRQWQDVALVVAPVKATWETLLVSPAWQALGPRSQSVKYFAKTLFERTGLRSDDVWDSVRLPQVRLVSSEWKADEFSSGDLEDKVDALNAAGILEVCRQGGPEVGARAKYRASKYRLSTAWLRFDQPGFKPPPGRTPRKGHNYPKGAANKKSRCYRATT